MRKIKLLIVVSIFLTGCASTVEKDVGFGADSSLSKYDEFFGYDKLDCPNLAGKTFDVRVTSQLASSFIGEIINYNTGKPDPYNYEGDVGKDIVDRVSSLLSERCGASSVPAGQSADIKLDINLKRLAWQVLNYSKIGDDPGMICVGYCKKEWEIAVEYATVLDVETAILIGDDKTGFDYQHNLVLSGEEVGKYEFIAYIGAESNGTTKWVVDYDDSFTVASQVKSFAVPRLGRVQYSGYVKLFDVDSGEELLNQKIEKDSLKFKIGGYEHVDPTLNAADRLYGKPEGNVRVLIADFVKGLIKKSDSFASVTLNTIGEEVPL